MQESTCPRCNSTDPREARFCSQCGLSLADATHGAGRTPHPDPASVPPEFVPCADAAQLYYHWESSLGGKRLIGTEGITVKLFNAGYALRAVELTARGTGRDNEELFLSEQSFEELPHGGTVEFEIASYEIATPLRQLHVALVSAEFGLEKV